MRRTFTQPWGRTFEKSAYLRVDANALVRALVVREDDGGRRRTMNRLLGVLTVVLGLGAVACGNNDCEDAADKLVDECGVPEGDDDEDEISECSSDAECAAKCTNDASCSEIKAFFEDFTIQNSYSECLVACAT
jgi:hypothetical protein